MNSIYAHSLIFLGCGLGGLCRYWVSNILFYFFRQNLPLGTLCVNFTGSFLVGTFFILTIEKFNTSSHFLRAFLLIGFFGGYTTLSAFAIETINLTINSEIFLAILNILLNTVLCLAAAWLGMKLGRIM